MKKLIGVFAAVAMAAAPLSARAGGLVIPPIIPDCIFGYCITFTNSTTLMLVQQLENDINQAQALFGGIGSRLGNPGAAIGAITGAIHAANPLVEAHAAASTIQTQQPATATNIAAADAAATSASGAHADAQAQSLYLSTIAQQQAQANQLKASEIEQNQAIAVSEVDQLKAATTGAGNPALAP